MIESLFIIALSILLYSPTWKYGLVVVDIRHSKEILDGYLENQSLLNTIKMRLYGIGTLSRKRKINVHHEHIL